MIDLMARSRTTLDQALSALDAPLELSRWARSYDSVEEAFEACHRGDWLIWLAALGRVPVALLLEATRAGVASVIADDAPGAQRLQLALALVRPDASPQDHTRAVEIAESVADEYHGTYRTIAPGLGRAAARAAVSLGRAGEGLSSAAARAEFLRQEQARAAAAHIGAGQSIMFGRTEVLRLDPGAGPDDPMQQELAFVVASMTQAISRAAEALVNDAEGPLDQAAALDQLAIQLRDIIEGGVIPPEDPVDLDKLEEIERRGDDPLVEVIDPSRGLELQRRLDALDLDTLLERTPLPTDHGDLGLVRQALEDGDGVRAHLLLREATGSGSTAELDLLWGQLAELDHDWPEAEERFDQVLALGEAEEELALQAREGLGRLCLAEGRLDQAQETLTELLGRRQQWNHRRRTGLTGALELARTHRLMAELERARGRPSKAELALLRALGGLDDTARRNPGSDRALVELAATRLELAKLDLTSGTGRRVDEHLDVAWELLQGVELEDETSGESSRGRAVLAEVQRLRGASAAEAADLGESWESTEAAAAAAVALVRAQPRRHDHWCRLGRSIELLCDLLLEAERPAEARLVLGAALSVLDSVRLALPPQAELSAVFARLLTLATEADEAAGQPQQARDRRLRAAAIEADLPEEVEAERLPETSSEEGSAGGALLAFDRFFKRLRGGS